MARIKLRDGREFRLTYPPEWTLGEVMELESMVGQPAELWSNTLESTVVTWHSAQLAGVDLKWDELTAMRPQDFEHISEPDDPSLEADPLAGIGRSPRPPEDADPAGRGSTPTSSSTSPSGSD
jgi:hypothetical protein